MTRPPIGGPLANPEAAKEAYPIQVRIAHPVAHEGDDAWMGWQPWRLWSHHFKLDHNALRSFKEAKRDNPDSYIVFFDTRTNAEVPDLAEERN